MKFVLASLALLGLANAANLKSPDYYEGLFKDWTQTFDKTFDGDEYDHRLQVFSDADDVINLHNAGNHTYTLGHNEYSHLTWEVRVCEERSDELRGNIFDIDVQRRYIY